jgi:hypothetical protein
MLAAAVHLVAGCDKDEGGGEDEARGIAECASYLKAARECFSRKPAVKATMADSVDQVKAMLGGSSQPLEREKIRAICRERAAHLTEECR